MQKRYPKIPFPNARTRLSFPLALVAAGFMPAISIPEKQQAEACGYRFSFDKSYEADGLLKCPNSPLCLGIVQKGQRRHREGVGLPR